MSKLLKAKEENNNYIVDVNLTINYDSHMGSPLYNKASVENKEVNLKSDRELLKELYEVIKFLTDKYKQYVGDYQSDSLKKILQEVKERCNV